LLNLVVTGLWHFTAQAGWNIVVRWLVCAAILLVPYLLLGRALESKASMRTYRYAD
jgi:NADH-quinone oxidoreductase subunit H